MDWWANVLELALLAVSYFAGVCLRHKVLPHPDAPPLMNQILFGVILFFAVQAVMFPVFSMAMAQRNFPAFLTVIGLTMEHGFLLNEGIARFCRERGLPI